MEINSYSICFPGSCLILFCHTMFSKKYATNRQTSTVFREHQPKKKKEHL